MVEPKRALKRITLGGVVRFVLIAAFFFACLTVFFDLQAKMHWADGDAVRVSPFFLGGAVLAGGWRRAEVWLWFASLALILAAAGVAAYATFDPTAIIELRLAEAAAVTLAASAGVFIWRLWRDWRRQRAALKAGHPSAVERAAGGF